MNPRRRPRVSAIAATVVALLVCGLPSAAQAAANRPDLTVSAVSPLTPSVVQNGQLRASITVRNGGKASAPGSAVGLYLSTDKRKSKSDKILTRTNVKSLKKGQRRAATAKGKLPKSVKRGAYVLIACADDKSRAKESNERNNCRPIKGKIGVTVAAKPVAVGPHFDTANAADGPIRADGGGTVVTAGADGTTYTLIIPDRALTHDVRVTLTPITSIDGLPLSGGLVAGVQVGTDALQLARPAQLVIQRSGLGPAPSQVAFGYHGLGGDFFLTPFGTRPAGYPSDAITIPVLHGGGYGIANATAADVAAQRAKLPARPEDQLAQAAAVLGGAAKRSVHARATFDPDSFIAQARQIYAERVQPEMTAAETNDALIPQAFADAFGWMRTLALLGVDDQFQKEFDQITNSMVKAVNNAYEKAKQRCQAGDYNQVTRLIQIERTRQLLGFGDEKSNIGEDIDKCLSFELRVTSHVEVHEQVSEGHVDQVSELKSTVPLHFDFSTMRLSGQAPFEYKQFSYDAKVTVNGCTGTDTATGTLVNSVLDVPSATVSTNDPGAPPTPPEVSMIVDPGQPLEEIHSEGGGGDCGGAFSENQMRSEWLFEWQTFFHTGDSFDNSTGGPWFFDQFTPGARPSVGTRSFHLVVGARSLDETWEVVHTPKF